MEDDWVESREDAAGCREEGRLMDLRRVGSGKNRP